MPNATKTSIAYSFGDKLLIGTDFEGDESTMTIRIIFRPKKIHRPTLKCYRIIHHLLYHLRHIHCIYGLGKRLPPINNRHRRRKFRCVCEPVDKLVLQYKQLGGLNDSDRGVGFTDRLFTFILGARPFTVGVYDVCVSD